MEKLLKPVRLDLDPNSPSAAKEWKHWLKTFNNLVESMEEVTDAQKFNILINYISPLVYEIISDCEDFESAINTLEGVYIKPPNEIFARHLLATRKQQPGESISEFLQNLRNLSRDCGFRAVTAIQYKEELIRDSFINGLSSSYIRQRLLENSRLTLETAFDQANSLDRAQQNSEFYGSLTTAHLQPVVQSSNDSVDTVATTVMTKKSCYFCGRLFHDRKLCPAREARCNNCGKIGHFQKVCRSKSNEKTTASIFNSHLCSITGANFPSGLKKAVLVVRINDVRLAALIDTGSTESYISKDAATQCRLKVLPFSGNVSMAQTSLKSEISGICYTDLSVNERTYHSVRLGILKHLCCDIILGQDFQRRHQCVKIHYGGPITDLDLSIPESYCSLAQADLEKPSLFENLLPNCKPIATPSRRFSKEDQTFISSEVDRLLLEGVIEESNSPWRAQIVIVKSTGKKRLCIDYSQTINLYTELDAYPLPRIDIIVNQLAKYSVFSTFDLKSAYHQIAIKSSDKKYTAFEANGVLYQFKRIPFGVTNGVAAFQRSMDKIIYDEELAGTFPYLDNITVAGMNQAEHDVNVEKFLQVIEKYNLTLNHDKTIKSVTEIKILGYCVGNNSIKPDPDRLKPLRDFPPPTNMTSLRRALGMFAYYAKWISNFSDKVQPLNETKTFPLTDLALKAFESLKNELSTVTL